MIVDIGSSALKRGYTEHDIRFALEHAHIERQVADDDPPRSWIFGFAPDATLLKIKALRARGGN